MSQFPIAKEAKPQARVDQQPGFLLTSVPWKESSLRVEVFSRDFGRVSLLARSARRRQSDFRGVLVPFVPIEWSWFGVNELRTLHRARWLGGAPWPKQMRLLSALYVNELVLKLTAKEDPAPAIYMAMTKVMQDLSVYDPKQVLRHFEWSLLNACGWAPDTQEDHQGYPIENNQRYLLRPDAAACRLDFANTALGGVVVYGETLQQLAQGNLKSNRALDEAFALNRLLLDFYAGPTVSRAISAHLAKLNQPHTLKSAS